MIWYRFTYNRIHLPEVCQRPTESGHKNVGFFVDVDSHDFKTLQEGIETLARWNTQALCGCWKYALIKCEKVTQNHKSSTTPSPYHRS